MSVRVRKIKQEDGVGEMDGKGYVETLDQGWVMICTIREMGRKSKSRSGTQKLGVKIRKVGLNLSEETAKTILQMI